MTEAERNKWEIQIDAVKRALSRGHSFSMISSTLEKGHDLSELPPVGGNMGFANAASNTLAGPCDRESIPPFSIDALCDAIITFIVANDQVSQQTASYHNLN